MLACTQDFHIFDPVLDGSASSDGSANDSATDATHPGDGGLVFSCGSGSVTSCTQCTGMPEPCVYCALNDAGVLTGVCLPMNGSCGNAIPPGFNRCPCASQSTCPESYQVCRNGSCRTCSESTFNSGATCQGGGTCNAADGGCN